MKKIKLTNGTYFLIKEEESFIFVVASSFADPLNYIFELGKEIDSIVRNYPKNKVPVVINYTPFCKEKNLIKVVKINYLKNKKSFDFTSVEIFEK